MRARSGAALAGALLLALVGAPPADPPHDPHGDPQTGVLRVLTTPSTRGECTQCHPPHGDEMQVAPEPVLLFGENTNDLAFSTLGAAPCHAELPANYPLGENDRLPDWHPDAGYFEANVGGERRAGVEWRGRWPGAQAWRDPRAVDGRLVSPHAWDPDMPEKDPSGEGSCRNCHDPHPTENPLDLLTGTWRGLGGAGAVAAPEEYALCFGCHGFGGPAGMDPESRRIEDWYDPLLNRERPGHRIGLDPQNVLSWPPNVQRGDMLSCSDCHNAHGSRGHDGVRPNAFLISDQRPEWSGLTDTLDDPAQTRAFCLGCHIPSDGIPGSKSVRGIVMNVLPDEDGHRSFDTESCHEKHGNDYSSPTSHNVHNPERN